MLGADDLPESAEELRQLVLKQRAALAERDGIIERLKAQLAWLRRQQFGRSSEKIEREIEQLELQLEDLEESSSARIAASEPERGIARPGRRPLPDHLPREEIVHEPACTCPDCGGPMRRLGEDSSEMLEYMPASFRVVRHVRPKLACSRCDRIVQSEAPSRPIARGLAGECQINCVRGFHGVLSSTDCSRQTLGKEDGELGVGGTPLDGRLPVNAEIPQRQIE